MNDDEFKKRVRMLLLDDMGSGDPRYSIPTGMSGGGDGVAPGDVRATVEGIYQMLKVILQRFDENMPWITRATEKDGGK